MVRSPLKLESTTFAGAYLVHQRRATVKASYLATLFAHQLSFLCCFLVVEFRWSITGISLWVFLCCRCDQRAARTRERLPFLGLET